ncbi:MAG: hypothetical protein SynsKO_20370 [Synoicihabitans sp.]
MTNTATTSDRPLRLSDYLLGGLLVMLIFTLPQKPLLELDSSWRQALAYFLDQGFPFGESIVFTYGPLGFLMGNTYMGLFWEGYIIWQTVFSIIAAGILVHVGRPLEGFARFCYYAFFILWGVGYSDALYMIIIAFCGWLMIQRIAAEKSALAIPIGVFLAFLGVIKFTNLLFTGFVVLVVTAYAWSARDRSNGLKLLGTFSLGFLGIWIACGQSPLQWFAYAINSLEISSGYQAAMGLPTPDGQLGTALAVFAGLAGYVIWHVFTQPDRLKAGANLLILAAFLFLNWKHGFVRADGHMLGFFYCAMVPAVAYPAIFRERADHLRIPRVILAVVAILCLAGMRNTFTSTVDFAPNIANEKLQKNIQAFLDWKRARGDLEGQVDHWKREAKLPKAQKLIGDATVDVLGFEQAVALFNEFNYTPRPIFQSYSVYTPRLAELNEDFVTSEKAPEFMLLKLQTIDERPLLADDSHVMALFPHLYEFKLLEKEFYVFQRRAKTPDVTTLAPRLVRTAEVAIGESLSVEDLAAEHLWITIDLPFNMMGRLKKFLYKPSLVYLVVEDENGEESRYRIPRPMGLAGFQINPLVTDFTSYLEAHGGEAPRRIKTLSLEVAEEDRRWFQKHAVIDISLLKPTQLKQEYYRQLDRQRFSSFARQPADFSAKTSLSNQDIDGREVVIMHAPSMMTFPLDQPINRIEGAHGYPAGAYTDGGETDGAIFVIEWQNNGETRELYRRLLDPLSRTDDRGLVDFELTDLDLPAEGEVRFTILMNSNPGWDWTAWADIEIE